MVGRQQMIDSPAIPNKLKGKTMTLDEMTLGQIKKLLADADEARSYMGGSPKPPPAAAPSGRAVVVIDRGWIFAGDQSVTADGHLRLDNAVHVFRWEGQGFAAVVKDPTTKTDLRPCDPVEVPLGSVIFRVPVGASWGK